jgi:glycine radical enzyme activase, yjjW family
VYSADINKIIPFSSVDGPGNRTAIFLQGCNFNCKYCHNPETRNLCINCMDCVPVCPADALSDKDGKVIFAAEKCIACDNCIKVCKHGATPRIVRMTSKETFEKICENVPFIRGVTFSGGECTLYPDFMREVFVLCKQIGLGTMIDSNGSIDFKNFSDLLEVCDGVMLDIKAYDYNEHIKVTDVGNDIVLKNAKYLAGMGKLFEVRTVVVPELFDFRKTVDNVSKELAPFLKISNIRYKIISYRKNGVRKEYRDYKSPTNEEMNEAGEIAIKNGFSDIVLI